jgi:hypothetical protein
MDFFGMSLVGVVVGVVEDIIARRFDIRKDEGVSEDRFLLLLFF